MDLADFAEQVARCVGGTQVWIPIEHRLEEVIAWGQGVDSGQGITFCSVVDDCAGAWSEYINVACESKRGVLACVAKGQTRVGVIGSAQDNKQPARRTRAI